MLSALLLYICNNFINKIPLHFIRLIFYRRVMRFEIGRNSSVLLGVKFYGSKNFKMGENSVVNDKCRIDNRGMVVIGNNVSISSETFIITAYHDIQAEDFDNIIKNITIEDYVFIGIRATVLPGVNLSYGSVVAACSTVIKSVPELTIVGGAPAIKIGQRNKVMKYNLFFRPLFQ